MIAAVPEELAKLGSVYLFAWRRPEFDERMDGIAYGARAGLGFALVENVAYLLTLPHDLREYVVLLLARAVLVVPGSCDLGRHLGILLGAASLRWAGSRVCGEGSRSRWRCTARTICGCSGARSRWRAGMRGWD